MKMLLALMFGILCLTASFRGQSQECNSELQNCFTVFMADLMGHPQESKVDIFCQDLKNLLKCIDGVNCDIPEAVKKDYINRAQQQLSASNMNCDLSGGSADQKGGKGSNDKAGNRSSAAEIGVFLIATTVMVISVFFNFVF